MLYVSLLSRLSNSLKKFENADFVAILAICDSLPENCTLLSKLHGEALNWEKLKISHSTLENHNSFTSPVVSKIKI